MTKGKLLEMLDGYATDYVKIARESIIRNKHMNEFRGEGQIDQNLIDALIVDFVNYIGNCQGLDYGLYTHYLWGDKKDDKDIKQCIL